MFLLECGDFFFKSILYRSTNIILIIFKKKRKFSVHLTISVWWSIQGLMDCFAFILEMIVKFFIPHITVLSFSLGTSSSSHDRKSSSKRVIKADPFDSPHTPPSLLSLKIYKYTFSSHIQKSFLSWPNFIGGGVIYTNDWKAEALCLELCWPLFSRCSQWSKLILPLKSIFMHRT